MRRVFPACLVCGIRRERTRGVWRSLRSFAGQHGGCLLRAYHPDLRLAGSAGNRHRPSTVAAVAAQITGGGLPLRQPDRDSEQSGSGFIVRTRGIPDCAPIFRLRLGRFLRNLRRSRSRIGVNRGLRFRRFCRFRSGNFRLRVDRSHAAHHGRWPGLLVAKHHFALAAIATAEALLANMIAAHVFGATRADLCCRFRADATDEWHGSGYFLPSPLRAGAALRAAAGGCVARIPRQRCASRSITSHSCSRWVVRLTMYV
jgi:hypothetical protein